MQKQNLDEYRFIRNELEQLKNCITAYMGFILGGSGVAFFGISAVAKIPDSHNALAYSCFLISYVIPLVLLILFYKFNSHNRYAGYCKLLNQEHLRFPEGFREDDQYMSWEICVDLLRKADSQPEILYNKCEKIDIPKHDKNTIRLRLHSYYEEKLNRKNCSFKKGCRLLFHTFFGHDQPSDSWRFPVYSVTVFAALNIMFIFIGFYFLDLKQMDYKTMILNPMVLLSTIILQTIIWRKYLWKLCKLMQGSCTIDAFCWRFLPIRYDYIKQQNSAIGYELITLFDESPVGAHFSV
ncbi:hypothetical protein KC799_01095 [candidate division KSB1 bacterium]|nr:hypothetical protein [candidate division KSB1 bacterium]